MGQMLYIIHRKLILLIPAKFWSIDECDLGYEQVGIPIWLRSVRKWRHNDLVFFGEIYDLYMHRSHRNALINKGHHDLGVSGRRSALTFY